jgi:hypothetical protein
MQLTNSQIVSYRAALDDVRDEIKALAGTGQRAHDEAIASALELVAKLKSRDHATVAPQRRVTTPTAKCSPNHAVGVTIGARQGPAWLGSARQGMARQG